MSPGETKTFTLTFPEDYRDASLRGKPAGFTVAVKDLKEKILPRLDDEFAKDVGDFPSLDALRVAVRESYVREETERRQEATREALVDRLLERNPIEVPPALVEEQARALLREWQRRLARQGLEVSRLQLDPERLAEQARERARRQVHAGLVLEAVARQESLQVTDAELDARVARLAQGARQTPESVRRRLEESGRIEDLRASLLEEKAVEYLLGQARRLVGGDAPQPRGPREADQASRGGGAAPGL
jgi:trigger factor